MEIRNVSYPILALAADLIGARIVNHRVETLKRSGIEVHRFVLRPDEDCKFRRLSVPHPWRDSKQRRVHAICWHGHRDFFRALFLRAPEAVAKTAFAKYTAENFEAVFPETGRRNIGSQILPCRACEACDCVDAGICG
jgi:hypothetical protein